MSNSPVATGATHAETFYSLDELLTYLRENNGLKISRSSFLIGVKAGTYPEPSRFSPRRPVWKKSAIDSLVAAL